MPQVTIAEAALLAGKSRQTINKLTQTGKLTFTHNAENAKVIDYAELHRVFPDVEKFENLEKLEEEGANAAAPDSGVDSLPVLQARLEAAIRERDLIASERTRERHHFEAQIENLQTSLAAAQDQNKSALLLLTHNSGEKEGLQTDGMKELARKVEMVNRQNRILNKKLEAQANQTFWQWLVGKKPTQMDSQKPANVAREA